MLGASLCPARNVVPEHIIHWSWSVAELGVERILEFSGGVALDGRIQSGSKSGEPAFEDTGEWMVFAFGLKVGIEIAH